MERTRKRTEIIIETETHVVLRRRGGLRGWCDPCGGESRMINPLEAAMLAGVPMLQIYERVEAGALHSKALQDGTVLICAPSLGLTEL
jgi:hypothetical protein